MADFWNCVRCGCQSIIGDLEICPHCHKPKKTEDVPAAPAPVVDPGDSSGSEVEPQAPVDDKEKSSAKSK